MNTFDYERLCVAAAAVIVGLSGIGARANDFKPVTQDMLVVSAAERLVSFDFKTQKWSELLSGDFASCAPSPDSKYIYCATTGAEPNALRVRLSDNKVETITSLKSQHRSGVSTAISVAPDGSLLLTRDVGTQEVYALTVKWP